jgi:hypothetical protein
VPAAASVAWPAACPVHVCAGTPTGHAAAAHRLTGAARGCCHPQPTGQRHH